MRNLIYVCVYLMISSRSFSQNYILLSHIDSSAAYTKSIAEIDFKANQELIKKIESINERDSINMAIVYFDSIFDLPDVFFTIKNIGYIQITSKILPSIDKRFSKLKNLSFMEIICDTLYHIDYRIGKLKAIKYIDIAIKSSLIYNDKNLMPFEIYSTFLQSDIQKIVRIIKTDYFHISINGQLWRKENGRTYYPY
jgi:hypothetical protein